MHHPRTQDLQPGIALADLQLAAFPGTADVHLGRGFGEGEMRRAEAQLDRWHLEEGPAELLQRPFQMRHADVAVDGHALDLVEHRRVRLIHVHAIDAARRDHADRGAVILHGADLHRRRVGAQHVRRTVVARRAVHEEGVVLLPCGMFGGDVQGVEIVPVAFDLRPFGDGKAHVGKDRGDLVGDLADRVDRPLTARAARKGHVQPFVAQTRVQRRILKRQLARAQGGVDLVADLVQRLAGGLALLRGHAAQLAHHQAQLAFLAKRGQAHVLNGLRVGGGRNAVQPLLAQGGQIVHRGAFPGCARVSMAGRAG